MPGKPTPCPREIRPGSWTPTGNVRLRVGFFGGLILEEEEETRNCTRRAGDGYSPRDWDRQTRWRRAPRGVVLDIRDLLGGAS